MASYRKAVVGIGLALAVVAGASESARLVVSADAVVQVDAVRLRDVATLDGTAADALGDVVLGRAANAGESRTFDGGYILGTLRRAGLDPAAVTYSIPPLVRVRRAGQTLDAAAFRPVIERWLETTLGAGARDAEVREVTVDNAVVIPVGSWEARVISAPRDSVAGRVRVQLEITAVDRPVRTVWLTADVARWVPVVVARRTVDRGTIVGRSDVDLERRELSTLPRDVVTDVAEVVGSALRQSVIPFAPIRREQLVSVPIVRRGDAVQIIAQHGAVRVSAAGEVRQDARRGEQVRVVNRTSQKELLARVIDGSTVEVAF